MCGVLVYFEYCYDVCAVFWCILNTVTMYVRCSGIFCVVLRSKCGVLVCFEYCHYVCAVFWCIFLRSTFIRLHLYPLIELKNLITILRMILYEGEICSVALREDPREECLRMAS